jgi:hypothetical protein
MAAVWTKLAQLQIEFMQKCKTRDALVASFQFYEEAFQCEELPGDIKSQFFANLETLTSFLLRTESANSALFGSMGRLVRLILPTQKPGLTDESLQRWIDLIKRLIMDMDAGNFLPPTTHKTLDALNLLFPLPERQVELIYRALVLIACHDPGNARLTQVALEHIVEICERKVPDEMIPNLFVLSARLFPLKPARRLLLFFVERNMRIQDEILDDVCRSLIELGQSETELTEKTGTCILNLFLRLSPEMKMRFVENHAQCRQTQKSLWKRYLDPSSDAFDKASACLCTKAVVENMGRVLSTSVDESLMEVLAFLRDAKTTAAAFGDGYSGEHRHVNALIPSFADLILHPSEDVRKIVREIFLLLVES